MNSIIFLKSQALAKTGMVLSAIFLMMGCATGGGKISRLIKSLELRSAKQLNKKFFSNLDPPGGWEQKTAGPPGLKFFILQERKS